MICPNCKKNIDDDSRFCRFCGVEFIGEETVIDIEPDEDDYDYPTKSKSEYGRKKRISKLCIALVVTIIVALVVILTVVSMTNSDEISKTNETITDAAGEEYREGWGNTTISVKDTDGTVREIKTDKSYLSASSILTEYTTVMNQLKSDAPAYSKLRYQNLPTEYQNLGGLGNLVLPIIERYVTSKSAAKAVTYSVGNADNLPVIDSSYGCILTDSEKIKNAYCEILEDGKYKLVITVVDELNPEILPYGTTSTQSAISGIFDPYDALEQITAISSLALSNIDFNYTDCTVTVIYDFKTKQVQSVNQTMNIDITANAHIAQLKARITDITEYTEFRYQ